MTVSTSARTEHLRFGPLDIAYDDRVLRPRAWTTRQAQWAASMLPTLVDGPVLELCCGAGHIGLLATYGSERQLVQVDRDPVACAWARINSTRAGRVADVRRGDLAAVLAPEERFALVIADPPWVPHAEVITFPEDPPPAIDGGPDGLDVARRCLEVIGSHLLEDGAAVLQLGTEEQASALAPEIEAAGLKVGGQELVLGRGMLVCLRRS